MKVRFSLPISGCPATLAVRSSGTLNEKDYVLKIAFPGADVSRQEAIDLNLSYSDSFKSAFLYNGRQAGGESGKTPFFRIPEGAASLEVTVERWQKSIEIAPITAIQLNVLAPWEKFNRLTINGVEADG